MYYCRKCGHISGSLKHELIKFNYHKQSCEKCDSENVIWSTDPQYIKIFYRLLKLERILNEKFF
jgi:Zn finger protein HypA/HybF involved in hydrogenase expression